MKKIIFALLACVLAAAPAHAQKTKAQISAEIVTLFPDNVVGAITPTALRTVTNDIAISIMPTAPVVSGNLACFSGTTGLLQDCALSPTSLTLPVGNITGMAAGCNTFLITATSANLRGCVSDESGSGALYFQNGDLGTPSAGVGTNLTALNASNLSSGTVAAARGGAGTITGALKGNGAGVVTQAACADLSNATYCAATVGQLPGISSNTAASAGNIGELVSANIAFASRVAMTFQSIPNSVMQSVSITSGEWDCSGNHGFETNTGALASEYHVEISTTGNGSLVTAPNNGCTQGTHNIYTANQGQVFPNGACRISVNTTTTVNQKSYSTWGNNAGVGNNAAGGQTMYGYERCTRVH